MIAQLGGEMNGIAVILLFLFFAGFNSLWKSRKIRAVFAVLCSLFLLLQIVSLYATQTFIGYSFYVHLNMGGIQSMAGLFNLQLFIALLLEVFFISVFYLAHPIIYHFLLPRFKMLKFSTSIKLLTIIFTLAAAVTVLTKSRLIENSKTLLSLFETNATGFQTALKNAGLKNYTLPEQLVAESGKNIIVLSLESVELDFLNGEFAKLTPNLNKLRQNNQFIKLQENEGSEWTSGSLYTYLTGFPAYFGYGGNDIFQSAYHSEMSTLLHILNKANYETVYYNGNTGHAGVTYMLTTLGIDRIVDVNTVDSTGYESNYGLRDFDLFQYAGDDLMRFGQNPDQPFALFISTTDTHFPNGIYDDRLEDFVSKREDDYEFMISGLDYLVGEFIERAEKAGILENTVFYIFPDHLKMGDPTVFRNPEKRSLYVISNAQKSITKNISTPYYQVDLPHIILNGAEIAHNAKFLADYIRGDKQEYIKNHIAEITEININGLLRSETKSVDVSRISHQYDDYKVDTSRFIAHAGGAIDGRIYTNSLEALDHNYKMGFRLFELDILKTADGKYVAAHDWKKWKRMTGYKGDTPVTHDVFMELNPFGEYTPLDMEAINYWFDNRKDAVLVTDKINEPVKFAASFIDKSRLMMELFSDEALEEGLEAGIKSAMPGQWIIKDLIADDVPALYNRGVRHAAVSRRFIADNHDLLAALKKAGIKVFVYNVNLDPGINEEFVLKYELDFVYGLYADKHSFSDFGG